jgi:hypothetical protein
MKEPSSPTCSGSDQEDCTMLRGIGLWLLGVPVWLIIIILLFVHR